MSELIRPKPQRRVVDWIEAQDESRLYLNVITIGEIQKGIARLPDSARKEKLVILLPVYRSGFPAHALKSCGYGVHLVLTGAIASLLSLAITIV